MAVLSGATGNAPFSVRPRSVTLRGVRGRLVCNYLGCVRPGRPYLPGPRCPEHTPAKLDGRPEPGQSRQCAPARCYCGECPTPAGDCMTGVHPVAARRWRPDLRRWELYCPACGHVHGLAWRKRGDNWTGRG